jgi:hypothetical protein
MIPLPSPTSITSRQITYIILPPLSELEIAIAGRLGVGRV